MRKVVKEFRLRNGGETYAIGGRGLLRRKLPLSERVELAVDLALGIAHLTPSISQAAALAGVPLYRVQSGIRQCDAEFRRRLEAEKAAKAAAAVEVAKIEAAQIEADRIKAEAAAAFDAAQAEAEAINAQVDAVVAAWTSASPTVLDAAVRMLSPSAVWDAIAPVVA
jgi:uncharacterized membrane protein YqiK